MSKISASRILSTTEFTGASKLFNSTNSSGSSSSSSSSILKSRVEEVLEITAAADGEHSLSSLDKIREATRIRFKAAADCGSTDEIGLREFDLKKCFRIFARMFTGGWFILYLNYWNTQRKVAIINSSSSSFIDGGCMDKSISTVEGFESGSKSVATPGMIPVPAAASRTTSYVPDNSSRTDSSRNDSSRTDSSRTDNSRTDSSRNDSSGTDSSGTDSSGTDSSGTDSSGIDSSRTDSSRTDGSRTGAFGVAVAERKQYRIVKEPAFYGWISLWRICSHFGPLQHSMFVKQGYINVILDMLKNPFQSYSKRHYCLDVLECACRRSECVLDLLRRHLEASCESQQQQQEQNHNNQSSLSSNPLLLSGLQENRPLVCDYRNYRHPTTMAEVTAALYPSSDFTEVPEGVNSPLCGVFWPVLRLMALNAQSTWNDLFLNTGYKPTEEFGNREVEGLHIETLTLLRLTCDVVTACPVAYREVPLAFLKSFVSSNDEFWLRETKQEEYRAHILRLLLENDENALKVFDSEGRIFASNFSKYTNGPGVTRKTGEEKQPRLVLEYLYNPINEYLKPINANRSLFTRRITETQDVHYSSLININNAVYRRCTRLRQNGSWFLLAPPTAPERKSNIIDHYIRNRDIKNSLLLALLWGIGPPMLFAGGQLPWILIFSLAGKTLLSLGMLEAVYAAEEAFLRSQDVYENESLMLLSSVLMIPINSFAFAFALSKSKWSLIPFFINRTGREVHEDPYRKFPS